MQEATAAVLVRMNEAGFEQDLKEAEAIIGSLPASPGIEESGTGEIFLNHGAEYEKLFELRCKLTGAASVRFRTVCKRRLSAIDDKVLAATREK